ncbi:MAG: hypothetical protein HC918_08110 [Oscillatoriales cyanobacterium SM2_1_8]|nr:hypothetical protein [Oscillatoriales cyanobacterium SM2_1_8]
MIGSPFREIYAPPMVPRDDLALLLALPAPTHALTTTYTFLPGEFSDDVSGTSFNNAVDPGATLNTTATPDGFGNRFASTFVSIGHNNGSTAITAGGSPRPGISRVAAPSRQIAVTAAEPFVTLTFDYAFQGNNPGSVNSWSVVLQNVATLNVQSFLSGQTALMNGSVSIVDLAPPPGNYQLEFELLEGNGCCNTALGFNNVVVTTQVPYELEAGAGLGVLALGFGYRKWRKSRRLEVKD